MGASGRWFGYAEGETIQRIGSVPDAIGFITEGRVDLTVYTDDGRELTVGHLEPGDYVGTRALTRQRSLTGAVATADTTIVSVSREAK
jgi:CRP-like cAMP-binding protein